jgi:glycosyltransferase involved in cell wall biosynthesis
MSHPHRRLRICRVIARLNVGGAALHVIQLTAGLNAQRFAQLVVTGVEGPREASLLPRARAAGIEPVVIPELGRELSARNDALTLARLYGVFRRWRPTIVETHTAKAGTLGRLAALLARVPVRVHVFHGHVFHSYFGPRKARVFLEIERALARATSRIVALGERQRRELLAYGVGTPEKVVSIPLGFDLQSFLALSSAAAQRTGSFRAGLGQRLGPRPATAPGALARGAAAPGAPADAPLVGIVGRLVPIKAHEVFFDAARYILAEIPNAHFVVVGDGERRAELEALAAVPPLAGHVHFLGWRADLPEVYADLDIVALTSDNEGLPTAIIEAMAAARPVVATDVGGVRDLVADGETGCVVPKRDPAAVARACVALLRRPQLRDQMGAAARAAVYPRYDVSTLVATMDAFYTSLVSSAGASATNAV